jgi:hypothetical protein
MLRNELAVQPRLPQATRSEVFYAFQSLAKLQLRICNYSRPQHGMPLTRGVQGGFEDRQLNEAADPYSAYQIQGRHTDAIKPPKLFGYEPDFLYEARRRLPVALIGQFARQVAHGAHHLNASRSSFNRQLDTLGSYPDDGH